MSPADIQLLQKQFAIPSTMICSFVAAGATIVATTHDHGYSQEAGAEREVEGDKERGAPPERGQT